MSKKPRKDNRVIQEKDERVVEQLTPKKFVPRPCSMCTARRPKRTSYSRVYSKHGLMRYCKCDFCGNTWSEYFPIVAMHVATETVEALPSALDSSNGNGSITTSSDRRSD